MTPELERLLRPFLDANPLLPLALGALASIQRFDTLLARYTERTPAASIPDPCSDALHALLGLVALRNMVQTRLEAAAAQSLATPARLARESEHGISEFLFAPETLLR